MKEEILKKLEEYHRIQGIAFLSPKDAEDYFMGLTNIVEGFYLDGKQAGLLEAKDILKK